MYCVMKKGILKVVIVFYKNKKVIIINKYFETEARINSLLEILPTLQFKMEDLSENSRKFLDKMNQKEILFDENPT